MGTKIETKKEYIALKDLEIYKLAREISKIALGGL